MTTAAAPAPSTVKPKLGAKARFTAGLAGMLGFLFISIGWSLIAIALSFGSLVGVLSGLLASDAGSSSGTDRAQAINALGKVLNVGVLPLVGVGIVGALFWLLGLFISRGILRGGGHYRPWGVTWAGLGIAILFSWVLGAIAGAVGGFVVQTMVQNAISGAKHPLTANGRLSQSFLDDEIAPFRTAGIIAGLVWLVGVLLIGLISWSLMARALRGSQQQLDDRAAKRANANAPYVPIANSAPAPTAQVPPTPQVPPTSQVPPTEPPAGPPVV